MKEELELFLKDKDFDSEEELERHLYDFCMKKWEDASQELNFELPKVFHHISRINKSKDEEKKKLIIEDILKEDPDCFEVQLISVKYKDHPFEQIKYLEEIIEKEKKRLTIQGAFKKQNNSYNFSVESYIKGLRELMLLYIKIHGFKRATYLGEEILRLDKENDLNMDFLLSGLYAMMEDESRLKKLMKGEDDTTYFLVAYTSIYFKRGNFKQAREYLEKVIDHNQFFVDYFKERREVELAKTIKEGVLSEVVAIDAYMFYLFDDAFVDFLVKRGNI